MSKPPGPPPSSEAYLWWSQGARDEQEARDEGLGHAALEVRDTAEALAKLMGRDHVVLQYDLTLALARIFCPQALKRGFRQ